MPKIRGGTFEYNTLPEVSRIRLECCSDRSFQSRLGSARHVFSYLQSRDRMER